LDQTKISFSMSEIYQILRKEILTLKLSPGSLLTENQVSARFNMSRTPVRNVFAHLNRDGLLEIKPKVGTYVSLIDLDIATQIIFMRIQVELAVMMYLTKHTDGKLLVNLEKNLEEQKKQIENGVVDEEFYRIDSRFHEFCLISCNKHKLWQLIQQMDVHYSRYRLLDYMATRSNHVFDTLYSEHFGLYNLIKQGKSEKLKQALTSHLYGGFLRIDTRFKTEYPHFFAHNERSIEEILLEIKLMVNEATG